VNDRNVFSNMEHQLPLSLIGL